MNTELQHKSIHIIDYSLVDNIDSPMHKHFYPEIHVILSGTVQYTLNNVIYTLSPCNAIIIPENVYHIVSHINGATVFTFQIKNSFSEIKTVNLPEGFCNNFFNQIKNNGKFMHYVTFITDEFFDNLSLKILPPDYSYIISEFFTENYNKNIHIDDIAKKLSLCPIQAQRIIKKHTGKTFLENLTLYRMIAAEQLKQTKKLSEIAALVGYNSYSGFWKAYQRYKSKTV